LYLQQKKEIPYENLFYFTDFLLISKRRYVGHNAFFALSLRNLKNHQKGANLFHQEYIPRRLKQNRPYPFGSASYRGGSGGIRSGKSRFAFGLIPSQTARRSLYLFL